VAAPDRTPDTARNPAPYRIAGASGFWGDRNDALLDQVTGGPLDAVMLDYLAEITMSILRVKRMRDPDQGYAGDFLKALDLALEPALDAGVAVVSNAGGINPPACAQAVVDLARKKGIRGLVVGLVTGDDLFDRLDELAGRGVAFDHLDTGAPFGSVRERVLSANAYLGAEPIAEALRRGARVVVTGRCTDSALALGPLLARFDWAAEDWDRRAAGIVCGHLLECGGQASGGNFSGGWSEVPDLARLGYPLAEVEADGSFVVTKHPGLGGRIDPAVLKEQLLYEIGDPRAYITPDVVADFTSIGLEDLGGDRVRVSGVRGGPPPDRLKVSVSYRDGWANAVGLTFVWPRALERAEATAELLRERCAHLGLEIDAWHTDRIGVDGAHGPMAPAPATEPNEVLLRVAVRTRDRESAKRFGQEVAPLVLSGVPGACSGLLSGRPEPRAIVDYWPTTVPRAEIAPRVEILES